MSVRTPQRTCVGCREVDSPEQMVRVVRVADTASAELALDRTATSHGRGAWVHPNARCTSAALSRGGFARSFKSSVSTARLERELAALTALTRGTEPHLEAG